MKYHSLLAFQPRVDVITTVSYAKPQRHRVQTVNQADLPLSKRGLKIRVPVDGNFEAIHVIKWVRHEYRNMDTVSPMY